ncbi:SDR family oxidoreductase [Methylobacterium sp. SI9]|uniref:SDR family NAD(P)-dependent oxidoreductase n=1 Tax=Methylobacterium guangdongense TaxID=3138811 RepID=UPI00313D1E1A
MSLFDLTGKIALITGSSRGIGRAIALRMAEHGARVVISSRKREACAAVVAEIEAAHGAGRAVAIPASISVKAELQHLVAETESRLGPVDVLVCNAASNPYYGPLADITDAQFRKILDNNVLSNHWLIQRVAPGMVERRDGAIVIVSSIGALKGSPVIGAYNVSKAADLQLARNYAVEYGPANVRVNCLCPGLIRTDFARALWEDPEMLAATTGAAPLRRIGEPDEIAGAAVFLASAAGRFVTGQALVIDGGVTIAR